MAKTPKKSRRAAEKAGESLSKGAEETAQSGDKDIQERERKGRSARPGGGKDPSAFTGVNPPKDK